MKTWSDSALTLVSRLSERLGPITTVIDSTMDRLIGQLIAQACGGVPCYSDCTSNPCVTGNGWPGHLSGMYYAATVRDCNNHNINCIIYTSCTC